MAEVLDYSTGRKGGGAGITVAKPSNDYRYRRYILAIIIFGAGLWFCYDGFYSWPKEYADQQKAYPGSKPQHSDLDILLNKCFGIAMPPLSLVFLAWVFYNSRGTYRFDGETLTVPGHPPVALKTIVKIDRTKWDRKGIAFLHYQVPGSASLAVVRLDDFIYDRVPTDKMFEQIESLVEASRVAVPGPAAPPR